LFLDFFKSLNQIRFNEENNFISNFINELTNYFNKPNLNLVLSRDTYWIDRIVKDNAVLINSRNRESYFVSLDELPKEVVEKDYWFIKIENNKYVIDYVSMFRNK
jgi:hypothetical protein